jgi:hypothetical protein
MANYKHGIDAAANDSDKTIVVPEGEVWQLDWLHATLVSTATVGNRQVNLVLYDQADVLQADWHAGAVQAASLTRHYMFQPGMYRETAFVDGDIQVAIPQKLVVPSQWYLRVYDSAAVAAAADDLTLAYQFTKLVGQ